MRSLAVLLLVGCATPRATPPPTTSEPSSATPTLALQRYPGGEPWTLASERGHVVLLDVWATWCEPCRDTLPTYHALQARYAERGLKVFTINVDEDAAHVASFIAELKLTLPVLRDPGAGAIEQALKVTLIPTSYVIDQHGVVRHVHEGVTDDAEQRLSVEIDALLAPK
ncbi:MAG: TlpA family protein disulfide reductase [Archangium sp.]|nr:TlpA family protein disulfide reductase [Archangium sp.]